MARSWLRLPNTSDHARFFVWSVLPAEELHDERQFSAVAPAVERICADIHTPLDRARANRPTLQRPVLARQNVNMRDPLGHVWILRQATLSGAS